MRRKSCPNTKLWFQNKGRDPVNLPTHLAFLLPLTLFPAFPDLCPWCEQSHGEWTTEQDILYYIFSSPTKFLKRGRWEIQKKKKKTNQKQNRKYHGDSRGGRIWESNIFHLYMNSCAHLSYVWVALNLNSTHWLGELKDGISRCLSPWLAAYGTCRTDLNSTAKDIRTKLTRPQSKEVWSKFWFEPNQVACYSSKNINTLCRISSRPRDTT